MKEELIMRNKDVFTSLVRIKGNPNRKVVSVKSTDTIEKELWIESSKVLSRIYISTPVYIGDIICKNIMNTGIEIICTKNIE